MQKMWGTDSVGRNQIRQKDDFKCNADLWYSGQGGHRRIDRGPFESLGNLPGEERGVMEISKWEGCYDGNWQGLIIPEAFSHPAKFAPGLIKRIFQHCLEKGYLKKGQVCLDPFGGIGSGGIMATPMGIQWIGVELEDKFVDLANQNFSLHRRAWETMGYPMPIILQGDSRHLQEIIEKADICVTSPPHGDTKPEQSSKGINIEKQWNTYRSQGGGMSLEKFREQQGRYLDGYGHHPGQIGQTSFDTYWQAVRDVYASCYQILKPQGVLICVVKSYIKKGRRVPLPMQTLKLLIHLGFEPLERIKAMLVKETVSNGLFGEIRKVKARKSFFRRLAESKGSPKIDWEEIIIARKQS